MIFHSTKINKAALFLLWLMIAPPDIGSVPPVSLKRVNEDRANTELCLAKETFTDWSCFET